MGVAVPLVVSISSTLDDRGGVIGGRDLTRGATADNNSSTSDADCDRAISSVSVVSSTWPPVKKQNLDED